MKRVIKITKEDRKLFRAQILIERWQYRLIKDGARQFRVSYSEYTRMLLNRRFRCMGIRIQQEVN